MKVLNCFLDNRFGGPQRRACTVAKVLQQEHNIETVFLFNEKVRGNIPIKGFKCFLVKHTQCITRESTVVNLLAFLFLFPFNLYRISMIVKSGDIDIVHANGIMNILPVLAAKLNGLKVIWHLNDTIGPLIIKKLFLTLVMLFSDKIAVAAKGVGRYYFGNNRKFWNKPSILYAPVDINKFRPDLIDAQKIKSLKAEFNISADDFVVAAIGNINMAKGYEYFIEAAEIIKQNVGKVKFLIVGAQLNTKERYWEKLQDLTSSLDLKQNVIFTGFRGDIPEILSLLDVFVLSSVSEACPIAVLEAMAMKIPVVATDVGGISEQVINGKTGIVVEPRRPDLLAEAILKIANLPKDVLEEMTNTGRRRAEEFFSLDIIAKRYKDTYEEVLLNYLG